MRTRRGAASVLRFVGASSILVCLAFLNGCSSGSKLEAARTPAALDNNSEPSLDPTLETPYGADEESAFHGVVDVVRKAVEDNVTARAQMASDLSIAKGEVAIQSDLPKKDYATRDVHRKTNGCYLAQLQFTKSIRDDMNRNVSNFIGQRRGETNPDAKNRLPEAISDLSQLGVFQPGKKFDSIVRFSNGHPQYRHDRDTDARGMAVKILPEQILQGKISDMDPGQLNKATVLDIVTINFPTFFVNDPEKYKNVNMFFMQGARDFKGRLIGKGFEGASIFLSGLSPLERKLAFFVNGSVIASPLFQSYFSMVPSRLGKFGEARAVKYAWFPESCTNDTSAYDAEAKVQYPNWARRRDFATPSRTGWALRDIQPHKKETPHDYLRQATEARLKKGEFCFALNVQLYRDQLSTNIEDSTDIWLANAEDRDYWLKQARQDEKLDDSYEQKIRKKMFSPYLKVASLKIAKLIDGEKAENSKTCEDLSFNPWNGRTDMHKPLGVVSRMKRRVYGASRRTRHQINGIDSKSLE